MTARGRLLPPECHPASKTGGQGQRHHERNSAGIDNGTANELMSRLQLRREQVARVLGVPEKTVDYLHRVKQLPAVKVGKFNMWKPETIREFVERLEPDL